MHFDPELIKNLTGESTIIRKTSTAIIQNRKFSLSDRFSLLRSFLSQIDSVFICADDDTNKLKKEKSPSEISKGQSLKTICDMFAPEYSEAADNYFAAVSNSQLPQNISQYLCDSAKLINLFSKYSQSVSELAKSTFKSLDVTFDNNENPIITDNVIHKYVSAEKIFEEYFESGEIIFEQILVNNMFYSRFPIENITEKEMLQNYHIFEDRARGIEALYCMLKFITLSAIREEYDQSTEKERIFNAFTDSAAALFRMAEHTSFLQNLASNACGYP